MRWQDCIKNVKFGLMSDADERAELQKAIAKLAPVANKRINRLYVENLESPAVASITRQGYTPTKGTGGTFHIPSKKSVNAGEVSTAQLRKQFQTIKKFLDSKTSTVGGTRSNEARQRFVEQSFNISEAIDVKVLVGKNADGTNHYTSLYWHVYHVAEELFMRYGGVDEYGRRKPSGWGSDDLQEFVDYFFSTNRRVRAHHATETNKNGVVQSFMAINSTNKITLVKNLLREINESGVTLREWLDKNEDVGRVLYGEEDNDRYY